MIEIEGLEWVGVGAVVLVAVGIGIIVWLALETWRRK